MRKHQSPDVELAPAYQRVSDGAWFCVGCLRTWLLYIGPQVAYRPCHETVSLVGIVCQECGQSVLREPVEDDLVTAYDDPLSWATSDEDWW